MDSCVVNKVNLMAGNKQICRVLQSHYDLSSSKKIKFLKTKEAKFLFNDLPANVSKIIRDGFLAGTHSSDTPQWRTVINYFQNNSEIIPALRKNPGTFTMLERMYHFKPVEGVIDNYFLQCKAGGQALKNRYDEVTARSCQIIREILKSQESCLIVDFGSGPGRNAIDIVKKIKDVGGRIRINCIDSDKEAINKGEELANKEKIKQISFIESNMAKLNRRYSKNIDFGLLIGVLCGMEFKERVVLLKILKRYFKSGGRIIAAALLDSMAEEDLLCAYILRETAGWELQYRPLGELKKIFELAGWKYDNYFQEASTQFYEIGVGVAI